MVDIVRELILKKMVSPVTCVTGVREMTESNLGKIYHCRLCYKVVRVVSAIKSKMAFVSGFPREKQLFKPYLKIKLTFLLHESLVL